MNKDQILEILKSYQVDVDGRHGLHQMVDDSDFENVADDILELITKPKTVIEISGGLVTSVTTNIEDVDIIVIDHDCQEEEDHTEFEDKNGVSQVAYFYIDPAVHFDPEFVKQFE